MIALTFSGTGCSPSLSIMWPVNSKHYVPLSSLCVCVKSILCLFLRFFTHLLYDCVGCCSSFVFFFVICFCFSGLFVGVWGGRGGVVAAFFWGGGRGCGGGGGLFFGGGGGRVFLFVFPAIGHGKVADGLVLSGSIVIRFPMQLG